MSEEIIVTGKTVEEAMANAVAAYGNKNASYDIAEMPKKGFLGIGSTPAKIKVTINEEEELSLDDIVSSVKNMKVSTNKGGSGDSKREDRKPSAKPERKPERKPESKPEKKEARPEKKEPKPERKSSDAPKKAPAAPATPKEPRVIVVTEEEKQYALEFANTLLKNMQIDATASFDGIESAGEGGTTYPRLVISGEGAGILIGHHGETLDAIQYLVNLSALRRGGNTQKEFVKIVVDIENYREKREDTLRALARRTAAKAQKYKKNVLLEPMNPYERRIIHSELQGVENISTHSVGFDENRKIVVTYEGSDRVERRGRRLNGRRNSAPRAAAPAEETVDAPEIVEEAAEE